MANTTKHQQEERLGSTSTHYATGGQQTKHRADEGADKGKGTAASIAEKAKDMAGSALETARDTAANIAQGAGKAASYVGQKAEDATEAVGHGMKSLGGTIRDKAPDSGILGSAASTVASALESTGGYLEQQGLSGIGRDVTNLIRRYPVGALCVGVLMGFMLARATRA